jgi:ankyrin repeat protein
MATQVLIQDAVRYAAFYQKSKNNTALHLAAVDGQVEAASYLLARGEDVNAKGDKGATPLLMAAAFSSVQMCRLLVSILANYMTNPNYKGQFASCIK